MATAQQRSLRVRTRAGGEPTAAEQQPGIDNNNGAEAESDDELSKGKKAEAKAGVASPSTPSSTWRPGRTLVWLAYLVSWAIYAYVRATRSLDLGAYSWWVECQQRGRERKRRKRKRNSFVVFCKIFV